MMIRSNQFYLIKHNLFSLKMYPRLLPRHVRQFCTVPIMSDSTQSPSFSQGQYYKKTREYFYFIDHQGMLFLDDANIKNFTSCFKDKRFLQFFFRRLKKNALGRHENFPYVSTCGKEINFIRCDDRPIVFTHLVKKPNDEYMLCYAQINDLHVDFQPDHIYMDPGNGRVYHPAPGNGGNVGLVSSKLAIEFSKGFEFEEGPNDPPTHFNFQGTKYELNKGWFKAAQLVEK